MNIVLCKIMSLLWETNIAEIDFCNAIGINKSAITDWKKGKTQSYKKHIPAIAEYFDLPESYFSERLEFPLDNTVHTDYDDDVVEVARAYADVDKSDKNAVRRVLRLPELKERKGRTAG